MIDQAATQTAPTQDEIDATKELYQRQQRGDFSSDPVTSGLILQKAKALNLTQDEPNQGPGLMDSIVGGLPRAAERFVQGINPLPILQQAGGVVSDALTNRPPGMPIAGQLGINAGKAVGGDVMGAINGLRQGNLEGVPVVGNLAQDAKNLDPAGVVGDLASFLPGIFGPKMMEGLNTPTRAGGEAMYNAGIDKVLSRNPDVKTLAKQRELGAFGQEHGITGDQAGLDKVQQLIAQGQQGKANILWQNREAMPHGVEAAQDLADAARTYLRAHTPIPDALMERMNDLVGQGAQHLLRWQDQKEAIGQLIKQGSPNSGMDMMEKSPQSMANELAESGLKKTVEKYAKGIEGPNRQVHLGVLMQGALENYLRKEPHSIETVAPIVAAAMAERLTPGSAGSGMMTTPVTVAGMAGYVARAAAKNPRLMTKLGVILDNAGYGPLSGILGHAPKIGLLGSLTQQQQGQ